MNRALLAVLVTALVISGCEKPVPLPTDPVSVTTIGGANAVGENTYQSTEVPQAILDQQTINSRVDVPSSDNGTVTKVTVRFNIAHTFDGDLRISLTSPLGTEVTLVDHRGVSGDDFSNTTLDDAAAVTIASAVAPFTGTFVPEQALSRFNGETSQGTWTLKILDNSTGDTGNLISWSVTITNTAIAPPPMTGRTFESTDVPKDIVDEQTVTSTIQVPNVGIVNKVVVRFNIVHTFDSDLRISLTGPTGIVRLLVNGRGSGGDNFTNTTLDDDATVAVSAGRAPFSGTFRPEQALSAYIGSSSAGTWTLSVRDGSPGDVGQITAWSLSITSPANNAPTTAAGDDQTVTRTSAAGANVTLDGTGSSDSDGTIVTYEWFENDAPIASGSSPEHVFALGAHDVTLRVTDNNGAQSEDHVVITVENALPTAKAGADQTVARGSAAGANVTLNGEGSSDLDGTLTYEWFENDALIASGSSPQHVFALGAHGVTLRVTDNNGAQSEDQVVITVQNAGPTAAAGGNQTVVRSSPAGANVTLVGTRSSDVDGTIATYEWLENSGLIASGATAQHVFALGMHMVTLRVTDNDGAQSEDQVVIMVENSAPTVRIDPPLNLECLAGGAVAQFAASGMDVDGDFTYAWSPSGATTAGTSFFARLGTTQVAVTVTDFEGVSVQAFSSVTVSDTRAPVISMVVDPTTLWSPNHAMVKVASGISASDACDSSPGLKVVVSSNQPLNGAGSGNTAMDWKIVANRNRTYDVYVRAERSAAGVGRIYTITARAIDASGNASSRTQTVTVSHSQRRGRTSW